MRINKFLIVPFFILMSSTSFAKDNVSYDPVSKNPVDDLEVNRNFEIPENLYIYRFDPRDASPKKVREIAEKINNTKKINENELPKHYLFYKGAFNLSEKRKIITLKCVDESEKVLFTNKQKDSDVENYISEKISKERGCNSLSMLSRGENVDNKYDFYDILFLGKLSQYPNNNDDQSFKNNASTIKILGLPTIESDLKKDFLNASFVTGADYSYIIIRKFNVHDLKSMSPEEYAEKDVDNHEKEKTRNKNNVAKEK